MSRAKNKGDYHERQMMKQLLNIGVPCVRTMLSRQAGRHDNTDLAIRVPGVGPAKGEVKERARAQGWKTVSDWLGGNDLLFLRQPYQDPLVVMPFKFFTTMVKAAREGEPKASLSIFTPEPTEVFCGGFYGDEEE